MAKLSKTFLHSFHFLLSFLNSWVYPQAGFCPQTVKKRHAHSEIQWSCLRPHFEPTVVEVTADFWAPPLSWFSLFSTGHSGLPVAVPSLLSELSMLGCSQLALPTSCLRHFLWHIILAFCFKSHLQADYSIPFQPSGGRGEFTHILASNSIFPIQGHSLSPKIIVWFFCIKWLDETGLGDTNNHVGRGAVG
jgi:hypothetical protein